MHNKVRTLISLRIVGLFLCICALPVFSQSDSNDRDETVLNVYTEQYYPLNYTESREDHDKVVGFATDLVKAVLDESGLDYVLTVVPWARAVHTLENNRNVIVYSMTRSPDRENKFHWIGEIWQGNIFLYGLKETFPSYPLHVDDIKHYKIGISRGSVAAAYLEHLGFDNLQSTKSTNYLKLLDRKRIDLFPFVDYSLDFIAEREGFDRNRITAVLSLPQISKPLSIAISRSTSPIIVSRLQAAYREIIAKGKYDEIMNPFRDILFKKEEAN